MSKARSSDRRAPAARRGDETARPAAQGERQWQESAEHRTSVRLTRKYAEMIDGVDLAEANVGDELDLSPRDANVLIAEGWAEPSSTRHPRHETRRAEWETDDQVPRERTPKTRR